MSNQRSQSPGPQSQIFPDRISTFQSPNNPQRIGNQTYRQSGTQYQIKNHSIKDHSRLTPEPIHVFHRHDLIIQIDVTNHQSELCRVSHNPDKALPPQPTANNAEQELVGFVDNSGVTRTFTSMTTNGQGLHPRHSRKTMTRDRPRAFGLPYNKTTRTTQSRPRQHSHACSAFCQLVNTS